MPLLSLSASDKTTLLDHLHLGGATVACLCAAWCTNCRSYRETFETLASKFPEHHFVWIDIEDEADWLGDEVDVENFPTLLIQIGKTVAFFGPVEPEVSLAARLIESVLAKTPDQLQRDAMAGSMQREWQESINLMKKFAS